MKKIILLLSLILTTYLNAQFDENVHYTTIEKSEIGLGNEQFTLNEISTYYSDVIILFKNSDSGTFTINAFSGETIDEVSFIELNKSNESLLIIKDITNQSNWTIVSWFTDSDSGGFANILKDSDPQLNLSSTALLGDIVYDTTDNELQVFNGTEFVNPAQSDSQTSETTSIASGSTRGLEQSLLAKDGQVALTALVVGYTTNGKAQGVSLGDNNVIFIYENGAEFSKGNPIFNNPTYQALGYTKPIGASLGQPFCFTGLPFGAIIVASKGFYGFTEMEGVSATAAFQGLLPFMSFGLSFEETFLYAFRNSTGTNNQRGIVFVANGPLDNVVDFTDGNGVVVRGQEGIELDPWEVTYFDTDGNKEYILKGTSKMMAQIVSQSGGVAVNGQFRDPAGISVSTLTNGRQWDTRLVLPTTTDGIVNTRSGRISAPYDDTSVKWYRQTGTTGARTVSPGSPQNISSDGGNLSSHNPAGYVRYQATGQVTAFSGADGQGGDAAAMFTTSSMSQVVAQPLFIPDSGNGAETLITCVSASEGEVEYYEWNFTTDSLEELPTYTMTLTRNPSIVIASKQDQLHPTGASISNQSSNTNNIALVGDLNPGVLISDVPIGVIIQAQGGQGLMYDQSGALTTSIYTQEDETAMYGWTPNDIKLETRKGKDGILYKRVIGIGGTDNWEKN